MAGTLSNGPRSPQAAYLKRRLCFIAALLSVLTAVLESVVYIMIGTPALAAVMCFMWFNASVQCSLWMILSERCRNLEQAQ